MKDFARSENNVVQCQLDRIDTLSVPDGRIGLDCITEMLAILGNPQNCLPPVFHVAGTNGKGSTCAFLRSILEADGKSVHVTTSPHLVRYNERIRIAGNLISDQRLGELLEQVLDKTQFLRPSFFEVTIAATFVEFAKEPADATIVEVGLGGRLDATNVFERPACCGVASLGIDHERFLFAPEPGLPTGGMGRIAFEKAGIRRDSVPFICQSNGDQADTMLRALALADNVPIAIAGDEWEFYVGEDVLCYNDSSGSLKLPLPSLAGYHQVMNAALAIAMLRHQEILSVSENAMSEGIRNAKWPARLQRLLPGPLTGQREVWLDGGHNPDAGAALGKHFSDQKLHLLVGMIEGKEPNAILNPLLGNLVSVTAVPISTHEAYQAANYGNQAIDATSISEALSALPDDGLPVLIAGSLYLAGDVLRLNDQTPD